MASACCSFEGPAQVGGNPASVEVARLWHDALFANPACINPGGIEGKVMGQRGIRGRGRLIAPRRIGGLVTSYRERPVGSKPLELSKALPGLGRGEQPRGEGSARQVVHRRMAGLKNAQSALTSESCVGYGLVCVQDADALRDGLYPGWPGVVPDGLYDQGGFVHGFVLHRVGALADGLEAKIWR